MSLFYRSRQRRAGPIAFLDRDGILNIDTGYAHEPASLQLVPGAIGLCKQLRSAGFSLIVVTNQSGLARGLFDEHDYRLFSQALRRKFLDAGIRFDAVLACPHLPVPGNPAFSRWCICRKPAPGLISRALRTTGVARRRCLMIGDSRRDVEAARRAGLGRAILYAPKVPRTVRRGRYERLRELGDLRL